MITCNKILNLTVWKFELHTPHLFLSSMLYEYPIVIMSIPFQEFLQSIVDVGDGRILEYTDGTKLSRRLHLSVR